jgi:hypothetical protein
MRRVLGVKSNNYYSYQKCKKNELNDSTYQDMLYLVKDIAKFSNNTYGTRRIKAVFNALVFIVSLW